MTNNVWERYGFSESTYFHRPTPEGRRVHRPKAPVTDVNATKSWGADLARHVEQCSIVADADHLLAQVRAEGQQAGHAGSDEAYFEHAGKGFGAMIALDRHLVAGGEFPTAWRPGHEQD